MVRVIVYNKAGKPLSELEFPSQQFFSSNKKARKFIYERAAEFKLPGSIKSYHFVVQGEQPDVPLLLLSESVDATD